ncbi:MAG TPA: MBL fold metallo-hydrolase [Humisphaera sp.]
MLRKLTALFATLALGAAAHAGPADKKLDVYWIDTEGGAATLFVTPAGESVLIDTGNPGKAGEEPRDATRIFKAAQAAGLKKIDYLVTTHYHVDHFGGAADLAKLIPIGTVYDNGTLSGRERPSEAYLNFPADKRAVINPGDALPLKNLDDPKAPKLSITCIATRQQTMPAPAGAKKNDVKDPKRKPEDRSDNANSVVSVIQFGDWRMYSGGDVTWNTEEKLVVPANLIGTVDVYQVTHHGLDISNNPLVIQACQPRVAVFCNGATKGAMPDVMATVKSTDSIVGIYQMHKVTRADGAKTNVPDEFIANQTPECQGNGIRCAVEPDGKAYTISIPATKHEQRFETKAK